MVCRLAIAKSGHLTSGVIYTLEGIPEIEKKLYFEGLMSGNYLKLH
jgi:hypothetical protein